MKSILLHVFGDDSVFGRADAAIALAKSFGARITCLQVEPFPTLVGGDPYGGAYVFEPMIETIREQQSALRQDIEHRLGAGGVDWEWHVIDGDTVRTLVSRAALADVIVMSQGEPGRSDGRKPLNLAAQVAVGAAPPVLALPARAATFALPKKVLIAWNGSAEAANALRAARPFLARAEGVEIVEIKRAVIDPPGEQAAAYLDLHGIKARVHRIEEDGRMVIDLLTARAATLGADLLVMGAYGHPRMVELVFGGVTEGMMTRSTVPLLLAH